MPPIDLLPNIKVRRREQLASSLPRLLLLAVFVWMLVLGGVYAWAYSEQQAVQTALTVQEAAVAELQPVAARVGQLAALSGQVQELRQLLEQNTSRLMGPALDLLASLLPREIAADQVSVADGRVTFSCSSRRLSAIGQLLQNLQQTPGVAEVQFSTISGFQETVGEGEAQLTVSGYNFSVSFVYQEGK